MTASSALLLLLACLCAFALTPATVSGQSIVHYYSDAGCVTSYDWFELPVNRCSRADESRPYLIVTCRDDWSDWSVEAYQPADGLCLGDLDASFQGANSDACVKSSMGQNVWLKVSCSDAALTYTVSGFVMIALAWIAVKMQL